MQTFKHPNFILGILSFIVLFVGIALRANSYNHSDYVIGSAIVLGAIHWVWGIIEVSGTKTLKPSQRKFWLIIVIIVPPLGSMIYYIMHTRNNQLV